jgi:hypothetical protein
MGSRARDHRQYLRLLRATNQDSRLCSMRVLLLAALLPLAAAVMPAQAQPVKCPGNNTVEMRYCASNDLDQSNSALRRKISAPLFQQWQAATRAVCAKAYGPYRDGTIYPQLVVSCDDQLNRALLKQFQPPGN